MKASTRSTNAVLIASIRFPHHVLLNQGPTGDAIAALYNMVRNQLSPVKTKTAPDWRVRKD